MAYTPITVTHENISWALNANIKAIYEEMAVKLDNRFGRTLSGDLDLNGNKAVNGATPFSSRSAVTLEHLLLLSGG